MLLEAITESNGSVKNVTNPEIQLVLTKYFNPFGRLVLGGFFDSFRTLIFKDSVTETIFFLFSESHFHFNSSIYIVYFTTGCG